MGDASDPVALALAAASLALVLLVPRWLPRVPGLDRGARPRHGRRGGCSAARRDHRLEVRRHPERPAAVRHPDVPRRPDPAAAAVGADGGAAGRGREPALGRGRRLDDGRSPQLERRADGAGRGQPRRAARRRHSGHGRHRPHGHQLPVGRALTGRRPRPRRDAAGRRAGRWRRSPPTCRWRRWPRCCSSWPTTWASGARSAASGASTGPTSRCGSSPSR